ncbi:S4 domain-containing protein, partial [Moraxella catarrhalis]
MNHDELMDNLVNQAPDCGIGEDSDADDLIDADETTTQTPTQIHLTHSVSTEQIGIRLDKLCADIFGGFSRANLKKFIDEGQLTVNGKVVKPKYAVKVGD